MIVIPCSPPCLKEKVEALLTHCLRHSLFMRTDKPLPKLSGEIYIFLGVSLENFSSISSFTQSHNHYYYSGNHIHSWSYIPVHSLRKYIFGDQVLFEITSTQIFLFQRFQTFYRIVLFLLIHLPFLKYVWEENEREKGSIGLKLLCNWVVCISEFFFAVITDEKIKNILIFLHPQHCLLKESQDYYIDHCPWLQKIYWTTKNNWVNQI